VITIYRTYWLETETVVACHVPELIKEKGAKVLTLPENI
jgi:hypothetical protein